MVSTGSEKDKKLIPNGNERPRAEFPMEFDGGRLALSRDETTPQRAVARLPNGYIA